MQIGIIGAGGMGTTLARHLARLEHDVLLANSRGPRSLAAVATALGARAASVADAVNVRDLVLLAIPTKAVAELPRGLFKAIPESAVVVDLGNYHPQLRDGRIDAIEHGMLDSEWVAQQIGQPVVKAFNNILAKSLLERGVPQGSPGRIALPVAGDSWAARGTVLGLVNELGFDAIDGGALGDSWRQGTGTPAYCKDLGSEELRRALAEAERTRVAEYRSCEEDRIRRALRAQTA
ncbi:MAG: NAD(P)-binding domain-containing protein [Myxococcales bacterium]